MTEHKAELDAMKAALLNGTITEQQANDTYKRLGLKFVVNRTWLKHTHKYEQI